MNSLWPRHNMNWPNRNALLLLAGSMALGLAGFYLFKDFENDRKITRTLTVATERLERLAKRDVYPNTDNIRAAKQEVQRLRSFLNEVEKHFAPPACPVNLNNQGFRTCLETTRSGLLAEAERVGVEVPANYWFTFGSYRGAMTFAQTALRPLAEQLTEIGIICEALFGANVNLLEGLGRAPVDDQERRDGPDYLNAKVVTNAWTQEKPYQVSFQAFSSELAALLERLHRLPECFVVNNLVVEPERDSSLLAVNGPFPTPGVRGLVDRLRMPKTREFLVERRPVWNVLPPGPLTILDEQLLRITVSLQAVTLRPGTH